MDSNNISTPLTPLHYTINSYFGIVVGFSVLVSGFWVVYFSHELVYIRRRYRRAINQVRTFETEAVINDQKFKFVKYLIMMLICLFEIVAPISALINYIADLPIEYACVLYSICYSSLYLAFSLLNILTAYITRAYRSAPDYRQDKLSTIFFLSKLALSIAITAINYFISISLVLLYLLFIREFIIFVIKGRLLDRVIGWKQQDIALEFGSEGRVLAIKRTRRHYRWMKGIFIACTCPLSISAPTKLIELYLSYGGDTIYIFIYSFQMPQEIKKLITEVIQWADICLDFPVTILALVYLIYTILYFVPHCSFNHRVNSCFYRNPRQSSARKPFLH